MYTVLAPVYDLLVPWISSRARQTGLRWIDVQDGENVLEVGTGTGRSFASLAATNPKGWTAGVDMTPAMLARARDRVSRYEVGNYELKQSRASRLPYAEQRFDAVFSSYLVDVVPAPLRRAVLQEVHRVLRPGGRLVLVHLAPPRYPIERIWTTLARLFPPLLGGAQPIPVETSLRQHPFSIQRRTTCVQGGVRSAIVEARRNPFCSN